MKCGFVDCIEPLTNRQCNECKGVAHHVCSNNFFASRHVDSNDFVCCSIECSEMHIAKLEKTLPAKNIDIVVEKAMNWGLEDHEFND